MSAYMHAKAISSLLLSYSYKEIFNNHVSRMTAAVKMVWRGLFAEKFKNSSNVMTPGNICHHTFNYSLHKVRHNRLTKEG